MNEPMFMGHPVKRFKWEDLDGKNLRICVSVDGPVTMVGGVDSTGAVYILQREIDEKKRDTVTWIRPKLYRKANSKEGWREGKSFHWEKSREIFDMMESFEFYGWDKMEAPA